MQHPPEESRDRQPVRMAGSPNQNLNTGGTADSRASNHTFYATPPNRDPSSQLPHLTEKHTVQRPRITRESPKTIVMQPYELDLGMLNRNFKFVGICRSASPTDRRLVDPTYLVFQAPLRTILNRYHHFTLSQLTILAGIHDVTYRGKSKYQLTAFMLLHDCTISCKSTLFIFKELTKARSQATTRQGEVSSFPIFRVPSVDTVEPGRSQTITQIRSPSLPPQDMDTAEAAASGPGTALNDQRGVQLEDWEHLRPPTDSLKKAIVTEWQKETHLTRFIRRPCSTCSGLRTPEELTRVHAINVPLRLLRNDDLPPSVRPTSYNYWEYDRAILEPQGLEDKDRKGWMSVCTQCLRDLEKGNMPKFALCNWLYYARDRVPTNIKEDFRQLSVFEKALVCRVRTNSLMCRFSGLDDDITDNSDISPFANRIRHIRGNIISSPMDVARINDILPPSPEEIGDTICALIVGRKKPTRETIEGLEPILVRKGRVKRIIEFLIGHNPHYKTSRTFKGFSPEHLDALFKGRREEGVPECVKIAYISRNDAVEAAISDYTGRLDGLDGLFMENVAYTLGDRSMFNLDDMSLQALRRCKEGKPFLLARPGSTPIPDIQNPNWLSWAHPDADPFGLGGFHEPRRKRAISMELQLKHLLNVYDPFFENDSTIAFDVYNIMRKHTVNTSLRFSVPYSSYSRIVNDIARIDKTALNELASKFYRNPSYKPTSPEEVQILRTMGSISPTARNVPGSAAQKIKMRNEIRAIISQRGSPTLFVTINPADYHHPIVAVLAKRCKSEAEIDRQMDLTETQRANIALKHPVACAQFFDLFITRFVKTILRYGRQKPGIFGHCDAYYGSVETQGRGTLHCHMLIWLRDHPPPEKLHESLRKSDEHKERLKTWLDSIIDTGFIGSRSYLNREEPVTEEELQRRRGERHPGTIIGPQIETLDRDTFWDEANEHIDDLLLKFNWHQHKSTCWKYVKPGEKKNDSACRFGMDGKVRLTTQIDLDTGAVTIKRKHPRMTQYNPLMLLLMKCNTDVKFVGSGEDAKAFMYYVTDYITKAPLTIHAGLSALAYTIRQGESKGVLNENGRDEFDNRRAMTIAINSMLGRQEISHPQAMSYILGNEDSYTSETFQAVNWGEINRYVVRTLDRTINTGTDATGPPPISGLSMSITNEGGQVNASNQLFDYIYRPEEPMFADMNLYTFFSSTKKNPRRRNTSPSSDEGYIHSGSRFSSALHPQYLTHSISRRRTDVVPVLLGPRISRRNGTEGESESWARDMCILFKPWRRPTDLRSEEQTWADAATTMAVLLSGRERDILGNMSLISEGKHARDKRPRERRRETVEEPTEVPPGEVITEEDMEEEPRSVSNAYQLLQPTMEDETRGVEDDLYRHLEGMIGERATEAFGLCLPAAEHSTYAVSSEPSPPTRERERQTIEEQKLYMMSCKNRNPNQETPLQPQPRDAHSSVAATDSSTQPPTAEIMTLPESDSQAPRKELSWKLAESIVDRKNLWRNKEQLRAFQIVTHHAIEGGQQLLMYIGGKGGTGKSHIISAIVELFTSLKRGKEVRVGAPTGIAASLIGGNTIHSLLHVVPNSRMQKQRKLHEEWKPVKYFIIDEVSMIGAHFMATISSKLMSAKSDIVDEGCKIFGGVNMIFLGDFHQLAPPMQPSLFAHRLVRNPTFIQTRDNKGVDSIAGAYLWRQVNTVVILRKSKRHSKDPTLGTILDGIRENRCMDGTGRPIIVGQSTILQHLRQRNLAHIASTRPSDLQKFADAPVIVGSKMIRDALNACLLTAHARVLRERVYLYLASDFVRGKSPPETVARRLRNLPTRSTQEALGVLPLFKGMKVMVTENISVPYGIVNGSEGTVEDVRFTLDAAGRRIADVVYVKIPDCRIKAPNMPASVVPVFPASFAINQTVEIGGIQVKGFKRVQIPLVPAYAYTDYKSQGRTLKRAIIDITSARGQGIYVMLSRVTKLKGLAILRWFPNSKILQRMSGELREEIDRLERLNAHTETMFEQGKLATWPNAPEGKIDIESESDDDTETSDSEGSDDADMESIWTSTSEEWDTGSDEDDEGDSTECEPMLTEDYL